MRSIQRTVGTRNLHDSCARTLAQAARAEGVGSRNTRRAAARRFVKRHRRDTSYLRWVLRSVAASSALAVTLLGLGAQTASAATPTFEARPSPVPGMDIQYNSGPVLGDLDGDADLDLVSGDQDGDFHYYENTGSATSPDFVYRIDAANPFDGLGLNWYKSKPALGDLDGDGDLDVITGWYPGTFRYFENTGTSTTPVFTERIGAANPLDGQSSGAYHSTPTLGDLDGDGDLDLVAGEVYGELSYFENTGSAASPVFVQRTGAANPLDSVTGAWVTPTLGDVDGDGDLDLVVGSYFGTFDWYENTGDAASPVFVQRTGPANPLDGFDVGGSGSTSAPTFGDLDGDGDLDLLSGDLQGDFAYYENTTPTAPLAVPLLMGPFLWLYAAMLSVAGVIGLRRATPER